MVTKDHLTLDSKNHVHLVTVARDDPLRANNYPRDPDLSRSVKHRNWRPSVSRFESILSFYLSRHLLLVLLLTGLVKVDLRNR